MGPEVHWRLTRQWAREEGFSEGEAEAIAVADMGFDARYPARASLLNITRHFAPTAWLWSASYLHEAMQRRDVGLLGFALHCAQDAIAHGRLGQRHLLLQAGWGKDPDVWELASADIQARIEATTRQRMRRYLAAGPS